MMQKFVEEKTSMEEQKKIVKAFKQPGLKYLGENILLDEYGQEAFDKKDYTKIRKRIAKRLLSNKYRKISHNSRTVCACGFIKSRNGRRGRQKEGRSSFNHQ